MTTTANKRRRKKKSSRQRRKETVIRIVFWVCLLLLLAPAAFFGWLLLSAWMDTGAPILGSRFEGDLDPAITKSELEEVNSRVGAISGVEGSEVNLATATLRVYADISDSATSEQARSMAGTVYNTVTSILDPSVYFTANNGKKMYDLEVHVYNSQAKAGTDSFVYVIETKTSSMENPIVQLVSEPIDAELAQQLRDSVENRDKVVETSESNEIVVGGPEGEDAPAEEDDEETGEDTE